MTETTPPTPPAQPATPGQPGAAPEARPAPGVQQPIPGQTPPGYRPTPPGYYPTPPGYFPPPPHGYYPPPPGYRPVPLAPDGRPLASFGDRLVAYIVDGVLLSVVGMVFTVPLLIWWFHRFADQMVTLNDSIDPSQEVPPDAFGRFFGDFFVGYFLVLGISVAIGLVFTYVYLVEMTWKSGQTVGKRLMKLQIVPVDPSEQRSRKMFVRRWVVERVAGGVVPGFAWIDGLWQLWDKPLQQCLHDKAARTVVVKIG